MRQIYVEFPSSNVKVTATLYEGDYNVKGVKEVLDLAWEKSDGTKLLVCHPLSAGDCFIAHHAPIDHYPRIEAVSKDALCNHKPGQIHFDGWSFRCTYGPVTETLEIPYQLYATVDEECMEDYVRACRKTWDLMIYDHISDIMIITKKED